MNEEKFWYLLSVKLTGEATDEELELLEQWLQENPELGLQSQWLQQMWQQPEAPAQDSDNFFNRHLQRLSNQPDLSPLPPEPVSGMTVIAGKPTGRRLLMPVLAFSGIAASLIICLLIYSRHDGNLNTPKEHVAQNTVITRRGSKSSIQLPDGSTAWLNADSKLVYNENFRGDVREVSLEGEAFFDVVKDKQRPFIIHTRDIDIRVLGTAFNVRAYETEKSTETALFRGSVEVTLHNNPEKKIVLKPNEKLMVNNKRYGVISGRSGNEKSSHFYAGLNITVSPVHLQPKDSSALETLWIKNKLVFDAESLEEVAQKIERWYDVKVIIHGSEDLKKTEYSGIFDNESLSQVMEALTITGNFKYAINKNIVTIK